MSSATGLFMAYGLRWKRRKYLFRAYAKRRQLSVVANRTSQISADQVLVFACIRNELARLPRFLAHYRALGISHFLIVENGSSDGSRAYLADQPDVSLWTTPHSYRLSRFGMDWLGLLLARYGHGHWCLTVDADELLIYPHCETRPLPALTQWLQAQGRPALPAMMLELYPQGPLSQARDDSLTWFDAGNYTAQIQQPLQSLWIQGGPRARAFFAHEPRRAPTLNKLPLVHWHRRYAYVSSTHSLLPARLNHVYDETGGEQISGVLLHRKFLADVIAKSVEEKARKEHFGDPSRFDAYYDQLIGDPVLWTQASHRLTGWRQLEALGLMSRGGWV